MAVEAASKISDLNAALPLFDDPIVEGDDHIRLLKSVVKLDAFSKTETAPQTVVSPLTLNGLVTGKVGFRAESALPYFELREADVGLPGGLFRLQSSAGALTLRANTAPAGDFSTGVNIINYAAGVLNFEAPVAFDVLKIESAAPKLDFVESDQAAPAGRYRLTTTSGDFVLQKALTGEFATVENLLFYNPTTGFNFAKKVAAPMRVGDIWIGGDTNGNANANSVSSVTGQNLELRSGTDTGAVFFFFAFDGAVATEVARIEPAGTGITDAQAVVTLEKGDFRYAQLAGGVFTGPLSAPTLSVNNVYVGALPDGTAGTRTVSTTTGGSLFLLSGVSTGSMIQFRTSTNVTAAIVEPAGTALSSAQGVVTKEKGAVLYAAASSQRFKDAIVPQSQAVLLNAFDMLTPSAWKWGGELPESDERYGTTGVGFIAEDVEPVFPAAVRYEWVTSGPDENGESYNTTGKQVLGLDPLAMIAVLWEKVREQETRLAALEAV